jgi:hypothetical protein
MPLIVRLSSLNRMIPWRPRIPTTITDHLSPMRLRMSVIAMQVACSMPSLGAGDIGVPSCG